MRILIACEESQAVCKEMRRLGHEAYSCDIIPCSGGHPEWHIMEDALLIINGKCTFSTSDGDSHQIDGRWDMIIAFPPCTYLTVTGNRWVNVERYGEKALQRRRNRENAMKFFMAFANADCPRIAIENPIGIMSTVFRKPDLMGGVGASLWRGVGWAEAASPMAKRQRVSVRRLIFLIKIIRL